MKGHDAGLKGTLTDSAKSATFVMDTLKAGDKYKIAGKEYTIGTDKAEIVAAINQYQAADKEITVDGTSYTYKEATTGGNAKAAGWYKDGDQTNGTAVTAANLVKDGSKATVDGKEYAAMNDADGDGVDDDDSSIISTTEAKKKIKAELLAANSIGTVNRDATVSDGADANGKTTYTISKGYATVADTLSFNLHVGADADMTNKITVDIDVMNSANLGVKGLNVTDATGTAATYAVDAISDAIAKVSSQRSALGAVQNRLEHTIDNLDNIVENTTTAESRIRDTDMAEEMVEYSKNNILAQAGQSMLAQANQSTQGVLSLLQ